MRSLARLCVTAAWLSLAGVADAEAPAPAAAVEVSIAPRFEAELKNTYGADQGEVLKRAITDALASRLATRARAVRVEVVLEWAKPTHPTPLQLEREPGLDFLRSISPGGADLRATLHGADGRELGQVSYSYYAPDLHLASRAGEAWADARVSIGRFADAVARKLSSSG